MNKTRWATAAMIGMIVLTATACPPLTLPSPPAPAPPAVQPMLAIGAHHTCVQNGVVFCWGDNSSGQLGNGTITSSATPVQVPGITFAASLSAAGNRTCAVAGWDSNVDCWGDNSFGGLGDGTTTDRSTPTKASGLIDMATVSVGDTFTCATRKAGGVVCWGQVPGVPGGTTTPVPIAGLETATAVSVGARHACALVGTTLECFGDNSVGQLGDGTTTSSASPVPVTGVSGLDTARFGSGTPGFAAGGDHTCAVSTSSSTTWCWGGNGSGQLGDGTTTDSPTPVAVPFPSLAYSVGSAGLSLGEDFTCLQFTESYTAATPVISPHFGCWGDNVSGQLADGTTASRSTFQLGSVAVQPGIIAAGGEHACGLSGLQVSTGKPTVRCWGDNDAGQLGNGTTAASATPVEVPGAYSKDPPAVKPANPLPKVTFTANPKIVVAGQPVTFTLHITHPAGLISVGTSIYVNQAALFPKSWGCGDDHAVWSGTDTDRTITYSCLMPADAPERAFDNGPSLWSFNVNIRAIDSALYSFNFPFYLSSTSTDTTPPAEVEESSTPSPIALGQPFVLEAKFVEPHGPVTAIPWYNGDYTKPADHPIGFIGQEQGTCDLPVISGPVSDVWTLTANCVVTAATGPDVYAYLTVQDGFGYGMYQSWQIPLAP